MSDRGQSRESVEAETAAQQTASQASFPPPIAVQGAQSEGDSLRAETGLLGPENR